MRTGSAYVAALVGSLVPGEFEGTSGSGSASVVVLLDSGCFQWVGWGLSALSTGTVFTKHSCIFVRGCYGPLRRKPLFFLWNPSTCHVGVPLGPPLPLNAQGHLRILWRLWISCLPTPTEFSASPGLLWLLSPAPTPGGLSPHLMPAFQEFKVPAS